MSSSTFDSELPSFERLALLCLLAIDGPVTLSDVQTDLEISAKVAAALLESAVRLGYMTLTADVWLPSERGKRLGARLQRVLNETETLGIQTAIRPFTRYVPKQGVDLT